jgi:hypothetical protein
VQITFRETKKRDGADRKSGERVLEWTPQGK